MLPSLLRSSSRIYISSLPFNSPRLCNHAVAGVQPVQLQRQSYSIIIASKERISNNNDNSVDHQHDDFRSQFPKGTIPRGFWQDPQNRKKFFAWLATRLDVRQPDDWYQIRGEDLHRFGGSALLSKFYGNSLPRALAEIHPEVKWVPWRFAGGVSKRFWIETSNHRLFFDWAAKELGIHIDDHEAWYSVSCEDVYRLGGRGLLKNYYNGSLAEALSRVYPEVDWQPWRFTSSSTPSGYWQDARNRRKFFDWAAQQLQITTTTTTTDNTDGNGNGNGNANNNDNDNGKHNMKNIAAPEGWYEVTHDDINRLGGSGLMTLFYNNSLPTALMQVYPEVDWQPWRFQQQHRANAVGSSGGGGGGGGGSWWDNKENQRRYMEWAATQLGVNTLEDWYRVPSDALAKLPGGSSLLGRGSSRGRRRRSLPKVLAAVYPDVEWLPWRFESTHHHHRASGLWSDPSNHKRFFDWAAKQLRVERMEDWYRISTEDVQRLGGGSLLKNYYDNSLQKALARIYPDYEWLPWKFDFVPNGFWNSPENHRRFFDWAATQLGVRAPEDWYNVTSEAIERLGGAGLMKNHFNNSLIKVLASAYPEIEWIPWRFASGVPKGFWNDPANHRRFFDWVARQLGIADASKDKPEAEAWYGVKTEDVTKLGGAGLLRLHYDGSLYHALRAVYPEVEWHPWRFHRLLPTALEASFGGSRGGGDNNRTELRRLVEFIAQQLHIRHYDDWYRVSLKQLHQAQSQVNKFLAHHGGLFTVLKTLYPEHDWDEDRFHSARGKKSAQWLLRVAVQELFPEEEILEEFLHPSLVFEENEAIMSLDLWIPSLSLAFEYHGQQHFHDLHLFGDPAKQQKRDAVRLDLCRKAGITLITVPYWWDRTKESIAAMIAAVRPDLLHHATSSRGGGAGEDHHNATGGGHSERHPVIPNNNNSNSNKATATTSTKINKQ